MRVVSVPHSGTRTLVQFLGAKTHQHFGYEARFIDDGEVDVHIPIRSPVAVAESWARRGEALATLVGCYTEMFNWMGANPVRFTVWPVERLPYLAGTGDLLERVEDDTLDEYRAVVIEEVIIPMRGFFNQCGYIPWAGYRVVNPDEPAPDLAGY